MAITLNDSVKLITIDNQIATPANLLSIEGVTRHGDATTGRYSYHIPYRIYLASATFTCNQTNIVFSENWSEYGARFSMSPDSFLNIVVSSWQTPSRQFMSFYNATIDRAFFMNSRGITHYSGCVVKQTTYHNCGSLYWYYNNGNSFTDCLICNASYGLIPQNAVGANLRNKIIDCQRGLLVGYNSVDQNIYNLQVIGGTYNIFILATQSTLRQTNLIDCLIDVERIAVQSGSLNRLCRLNLKTTMTILIKEGAGATAKLYDKNGDLHENMTIEESTTKEVTFYTRYVKYTSPEITDELTIFEPFTLTISKPGFQDLTIPNITITPGVPTIIRGELVKTIFVDRHIQGAIQTVGLEGSLAPRQLSGTIQVNKTIDGTISEQGLEGAIETKTIKGEI
jgi:hypothetical protein